MKSLLLASCLLVAVRGGAAAAPAFSPDPPFPDAAAQVADGEPGELHRLVIGTSVVQAYMLTYGFMVGSDVAGGMIRGGRSTATATASWAVISLVASGLGWLETDAILRKFGRDHAGAPVELAAGGPESYRILWVGSGIGSITDFRATSGTIGAPDSPRPGRSLWTAAASDVKTVDSLPSFGVRLGQWRRHWGADMSISLSSYHTKPQTVYYDAQGVIAVPGGYVPARLGAVDLPDRFLLLRSLAYGGNAYLRLPGRVIEPYLGLGGALLVNSAQSEYAGPASLKNEGTKLALDIFSLGWQVQATVGGRLPLSHGRFAFAEFRPGLSWFSYQSGAREYPEHDRLVLQTFALQVGMGFRFK